MTRLILAVLGPVVLADAAEPSRQFTVATYNVLYLNRDLPKVAALVRQTGADFLALQETNDASEEFLREALAREYPHRAFRPGKTSEGFGFLSKAPLRNLTFLDPLPGWRGAWMVEVELAGQTVRFVSVHLATPQLRRADSLSGLMSVFQRAEEVHAKEMARINQRLPEDQPAIVLGDFNSFSFFVAPQALIQRGFVDSFAAVNEKPDQHGTWSYRQQDVEVPARIDFIFHSRDFSTIESRIICGPASDHCLVLSKLAWKEK